MGFAALLGLDDFRKDAFATGIHAYLLQRKYPMLRCFFLSKAFAQLSIMIKLIPKDVHEKQLLQVITAYRLFMPFANITISTRECARFRDNVIGLAATKISAGSVTVLAVTQKRKQTW